MDQTQPTFTAQHWANQILTLIAESPFDLPKALECIAAFGEQCKKEDVKPSLFAVRDSYFNHSDLLAQKIVMQAGISREKSLNSDQMISPAEVNILLNAVWDLDPSASIDLALSPDKISESYHSLVLELACFDYFEEVIDSCLQRGASLGPSAYKKRTPLMQAAHGGHLDLMKKLLDLGSELNSQCCHGHSTLYYALENGHLNAFTFLLENGAETELKDCHGETVLHHAALFSHPAFLQTLIWHQADIHAIGFGRRTACHVAAEYEALHNLQSLIEAGADYQVKNGDGKTPLNIAQRKGFQNIVSYLTGLQEAQSEQQALQSLIPALDSSEGSETLPSKRVRL